MDWNVSTPKSTLPYLTSFDSETFPVETLYQPWTIDPHENTTVVEDISTRSDVEYYYDIVRTVVPFLFGATGLLGFVGNFVVIVAVLTNRKLRSVTNLLILNLACADLVFIVACVPFTATSYVTTVWPFGPIWCKIYQYVVHVTAHASVYTLVFMSFDRFLAVAYPTGSLRVKIQRNASVCIAATWIVLGVSNSPMLDVFGVFEYSYGGQIHSFCINIRLLTDLNHGKIFYGTFFVFGFALPLTLVSVLYGLLLRSLREQAKWRGHPGTRRSKGRATRMVVVVVVVFAFCWLPLQVVFLVQFVIFPEPSESVGLVLVKIASSCLAYTNSSVNPILYAFLSEQFRRSLRERLGTVYQRYTLRRNRLGRRRRMTIEVDQNILEHSIAVVPCSSGISSFSALKWKTWHK